MTLNVLFDEKRRQEMQSLLKGGIEIEFRKSKVSNGDAGPLSDGEFMRPMAWFLRSPKASQVVYCPKCGKSGFRGSSCANPACRAMIY